jgi:16S rRNA (uracil1498-N3)-methyltransferase
MAHVPRLYVPGRLAPGPLVLNDDASHRLAAVMRVRAGDPLRLFSGDGREFEAVVAAVAAKGAVHVNVGDVARQEPPPSVLIETWCAMVRPNRFDWAIEKCTEAGADLFRPITSAHTARGDGASASRAERWQRIAVEAAEQSGRVYVPVIEPPLAFDAALRRAGRPPIVVCDGSGQPLPALAPLLPARGWLAVAIGPEGGWSADELAAARAAGALVVRLGPYILRTETAAVVATAMLRAALA